MLWWMAGCSSFMTTFSAWSFTGASGRAYEAGIFVFLLFGANALALIFTIIVTAPMFRQMRIITPVEGICRRFGKANEQFFTWIPIPVYTIMGGISLYAIGIFMSVVFNLDIFLVIIGLGVIVTAISVMGGSWAVVASDFLQFLTITVIAIVMAVLVLGHPAVGGVGGLMSNVPEELLRTTDLIRPEILLIFAVTLVLNQLMQMNSMWMGAARYVYVKNGRDARRAAIFALVGFLVFPLLWIIPAMGARILHPDLASQYPSLQNPSEAAYVASAMSVLPNGMLGVLVAGIFAATMSSVDNGLNRSAGVIVRNVYRSLINPNVSEKRQIQLGRLITAVLGAIMTVLALFVSQLSQMPLFDLVLTFAALVGLPTTIPLFFGLFVRRVPPWAGWSTALVGIVAGGIFQFLVSESMLLSMFGFADTLNSLEFNSLRIGLLTALNVVVCSLWFFGTMRFARYAKESYWNNVDEFFHDIHRPIDMATEGASDPSSDRKHYHVMGILCMAYGGFIFLMAALPNPLWGRGAFVFCGGSIACIGILFYWIAAKAKRREELTAGTAAESEKRVTSVDR